MIEVPDPTVHMSDLHAALETVGPHAVPGAVGLILGSGLSALADLCDERISFGYAALEGAPLCGVLGHDGRLVFGTLEGREIIAFCGRVHLYEGHGPRELTYAVRLLKALGARAVLITSAVGAVNPDYPPGAFMFVRDHINLTGVDPVGHIPFQERQPRFPDMSRCYDPRLLEELTGLAFAMQVPYHRGVLCGVRGPCYETPAEVRAMRSMGADAVSMSVVLEAGFAHYLGLRVLALGVVTNRAGDDSGTSHELVLQTATASLPQSVELLGTAIGELSW